MAAHDDLMATAVDQTGLDDFGDDSFREGLERLARSLQDEAHLNAIGQVALQGQLVHLLTQRLQIEDWFRRNPDIGAEPIDAPLIGLGLPRTGSTALSFLLAEDPGARSLTLWESAAPAPPPSTVTPPDPRIEMAELRVEQQRAMSPRSAALVPSTATGPMECQELMALDFKSQIFQAYAYVPSYSKWFLYDADLTPTYAYERRALQLLQWGTPARPWRLKCPTHLLFLDHLDRAFPDARFVMTHRDPADVIVSVADVYLEVASMFSEDIDLHYLGALNVEHWSVGIERALAFREAGNDDRFYDIDFRAMQQDPIGEVTRLYAWLGEPVTPDFEAGMARWWAEYAATREANVHPDPATFGIDLAEVRPLFAEYVDRSKRWTTHEENGH